MTPNLDQETRAAQGRHMQRVRAACDECRRRKLRCDGQQPQCALCQEAGIPCELTQRGIRGPKKGHLKALKNKVVHLEAMLEGRLLAQQLPEELQSDARNSNESTLSALPVDFAALGTEISPLQTTRPEPEALVVPPEPFERQSCSSTLPVSNVSFSPPDAVHNELDQLYLDRVHQSIPILHQRRYLSWSRSSTKTEPRRCLQYAMWTLASLLSTQFGDMIQPLYQETKQMLERLSVEGDEHGSATIELAQAWVLVVTFESMRTHHRQAWMSAGRAFRLVQAMRYHDIDKSGPSPPQSGDFVEIEERRRVFWMAYFLDHVISMRDDWPITLNEHVICTRLPASDVNFQSGQFPLGPFLSEAMTESTLKVPSSLNECLILTTICGRSLLQNQQSHISKAYGDTVIDFDEQRRWLEDLLTTRLQVLSQCYPSPTEAYDPLLSFVHILGQTTVIYFCKTMIESAGQSADLSQGNTRLSNYQNRALEASATISRFATSLRELPSSKIHPLMPIPLFFCAEFLYKNMHYGEPFQLRLYELFQIFRELKNVNNHDQTYLDLLPQSCVSKTNELIRHMSM